jgi:4-hydroxybenzoate polyprenyltransferase
MVHFIKQYLGWRSWAVLTHNSVIENIFLLFFIALKDKLFTLEFIADLLIFILFSIFSTTYGYLINDLSDKDLDKAHGKKNTFEDDSYTKSVLVVLLFLLLSVFCGVRFAGNDLFVPLWICWGLAATFYSLPPVRLKERGKVGLLVVVLAQRAFPALLIFSAFNHFDWVDLTAFTAYIFFRGLSSDLNHQLSDYQNDLLTKTDTFAVEAGIIQTRKFFRYSLETEKALLLLCLGIMVIKTPHVDLAGIPLLIPALIAYIALYTICQIKMSTLTPETEANPFAAGQKDIFQFVHHGFPSVVLPLYLLLLLIFESWIFLPVLLVFALSKKLFSPDAIKDAYPIRKLSETIKG